MSIGAFEGTRYDDAAAMPATAKQPARSSALLLIDLINPLDFRCAAALLKRALPAARAAGALQARARRAGIPAIYVNDLFESGARGLGDLLERLRRRGGACAALVDALPADPARDHFIAKPQHSGFFRTELEMLLGRLHVDHLILTGVAADICVLATAFDARMRGFRLSVPRDCVAAESAEAELWALRQMTRVLGADVRPSVALPLAALGPAG